jgi:hypothetical protein
MSEKEIDKKRKNRMRRNVAIVVSVIAVFLVIILLYFIPIRTQETEMGILTNDHFVVGGVVYTFNKTGYIYDYFWNGLGSCNIGTPCSLKETYNIYGIRINEILSSHW